MRYGSTSLALCVQDRAAEENDVYDVCACLNGKRAMMFHGFGERWNCSRYVSREKGVEIASIPLTV